MVRARLVSLMLYLARIRLVWALGADGVSRQRTHVRLVAGTLNPEELGRVWLRLQRQRVLGAGRFRLRIEARLQRSTVPGSWVSV